MTQPQAISGLGGIGKTQIAIEYAYRYCDEYQMILWIQSTTNEELIADMVAVAEFLNLPEKNAKDQSITISAVKQWFETHKGWLLIFDNADDLAMVRNYLPSTDKGHILLTTRTHVMGGLAHRVEIEKMGLEEGALFLLRRAGLIANHASYEDASMMDKAKAKEIVQIMDGLPLALDQAGAYIEETDCGLSNYLMLYSKQQIKLLKLRGGLVPEHPTPVATTWSLSFEKVKRSNPAAIELLKLCAFLSTDAIPEEIITEGAPDLGSVLRPVATNPFELNAAIGELLKYSLLHRDSITQTLSIHRLVQAVLRDEMDQRTQLVWAERAVRTVNRVFPNVVFETWPLCGRLLSHAQVCAEVIEQQGLAFPEAARLINQAGFYLLDRGQYIDALPLLQQALAIREKILGPEHLDTAESLNNLALLYKSQGKYERAESLLQRALAIRERILGSSHADTAASLNNLAMLYQSQGKYERAESLLERALAIRERILGSGHADTALSLISLAFLYRNQSKYERAESLLQRALAINKRLLGLDHPNTAANLNNLAFLYNSLGKVEQAESFYRQALEIRERVLGLDHPHTALSLNNLAMLYIKQSKYQQAEPLLRQALEIRERVLGSNHPDTEAVRDNYANLLEMMKWKQQP